jgi:hypothetical protein
MFSEAILCKDLTMMRQAQFEMEKLQEEELMLELMDYCDLKEDISTYETCAW